MKRLSLISVAPLMIVIFFSCRRNVSTDKYVISGRLLESSSNPNPVGNYRLEVRQRSEQGLFGGYTGIVMEF
jgi:hypothetical protein